MVKKPHANAGDTGSIPQSGRSPGGGNGNPFQYSFPENPMDRGLQSMGLQRLRDRDTYVVSKQSAGPLLSH